MNKKKWMLVILSVVLVVVWGFRVYQVNAGVAKEYKINTYELGEEIRLDNAILQIKRASYGKMKTENNYKSIPFTIEMEVHNVSNKNIDVMHLLTAKLGYGLDYFQTRDGEFSVEKLRSLEPDMTAKIILIYHVSPKYKGDRPKVYLDQRLYKDRVMRNYEEGYRLGIAIQL
ncbi:hypothetical protein [Virgibacillus siamensis]|uniref:hypothetical protein n=1 Tax=Virgibacillus siamensis TaxID=480071 RepID=UPI0009853685|nr:hypothetical protein [Virgibacillus siamensis]